MCGTIECHDDRLSQVFSTAWDRLKEEQRNGAELPIDPLRIQ